MTDQVAEDLHRHDRIMDIAFSQGYKFGIPAFALSASGIAYAYKTIPSFAKKFGYSAMSGIPLMVGIFGFAVAAEQTMYDAHRNPENYGLLPAEPGMKPKQYYIAPWKVLANQYIDSPATMLIATSTPVAVTIAFQQSKLTHLGISQRVLHSRVLAQGGILSVLVVTMMIQTYMEKRGRFYPEEVKEKE